MTLGFAGVRGVVRAIGVVCDGRVAVGFTARFAVVVAVFVLAAVSSVFAVGAVFASVSATKGVAAGNSVGLGVGDSGVGVGSACTCDGR